MHSCKIAREHKNTIQQLDKGLPAYKIEAELGVGKMQIQNLHKRKQKHVND